MSLIIFLIILSALVIVHEIGHFSVAKFFRIRVDEFGLGYPPRAAKLFSWKGSDFTLNWLPFGGFVKIFGENYVDDTGEPLSADLPQDSFQSKNRGIQASVLAAGVFGNFLFAWFLISLGFVTGLPAPQGLDLPISNPHTVITLVLPGSPAEMAGLKSGDAILSLSREEQISGLAPEELSQFIASSLRPLTFEVDRGGVVSEKVVTPREGIIENQPAVGISMETIGTVKLPFFRAIWEGLKTTTHLTIATAQAIWDLISKAVIGKANLASVTGPVGIVGLVSDTRELGFSYLLTFTALLSINLAIINLMPFPALDGGRLLFVAIEAVSRKRVPARVFNTINTLGFALLIFLMILITIHDVRNIF